MYVRITTILPYSLCFIIMPSIRDPDRYLWNKLSTLCRNKGQHQVSLSSFHEFQQVTEKKVVNMEGRLLVPETSMCI